jgi:uncharacterized RDD family membrane protein YckC
MNHPNPYQAPEAPLAVDGSHVLAGRGERLAAALIDGLIALVFAAPIFVFTGYLSVIMDAARGGGQVPFLTTLAYAAAGFALFVAVQAYPLAKTGQTWGKKVMSIRIVGLDGAQPSLWHLISKRYLPTHLISIVPVVGGFYGAVDALFIFRKDQRCLHDLIAGTQVVNARR